MSQLSWLKLMAMSIHGKGGLTKGLPPDFKLVIFVALFSIWAAFKAAGDF